MTSVTSNTRRRYLVPEWSIVFFLSTRRLAREPTIGLIMLLRQKGLKVCSEAEKYAELKYVNEYPRHDPLLK